MTGEEEAVNEKEEEDERRVSQGRERRQINPEKDIQLN